MNENQQVLCPCGQGAISKIFERDDHNRIVARIVIDCPHCAAKYKVCQRQDAGNPYGSYELIPFNYPKDTGYRASDDFPEWDSNDANRNYLIEHYPKDVLQKAYEQTQAVRGIRDLSGTAAGIVSDFRRRGERVSLAWLRTRLGQALRLSFEDYPYGTFAMRQCALARECTERAVYERERRKVSIRLEL